MPVYVTCSCGAKLKAPDDAAGKTIACPKCKTRLRVPSPAPDRPDYDDENDRARQGPRQVEVGKQGGTSVLKIVLGVAGGIGLISCLGIGGCIALIGMGAKGVAEKQA